MKISFLAYLIPFLLLGNVTKQNNQAYLGAWESIDKNGVLGQWIITEKHFAITYYKGNEFISTEGGSWEMRDKEISLNYEFHTADTAKVGTKEGLKVSLKKSQLKIEDKTWLRVDNTKPGELNGAWLITGRERDGEMNTMTPGARKTMKILSGTRFQWIAYNSETAVFSGTGGGEYISKDGKYTEIIKFFSRDSSRVGAELSFDFELKDGKWHHSGKSSKGDPIYEIWSDRVELGI